MADNIKYRFIQNVGDYFPSGYFSDDFFDKVQKCAGVSNDEVKDICGPYVRLKQEYNDYKNFIINDRPRVEDAIKKTHDFHTRLLSILGYDTNHPYQEHYIVNDESTPVEMIPVRHVIRQGQQVKMLVMEMQNLITVDDNEPAGLFEQQYESEERSGQQKYAARQWRYVFNLDTEKYKISPAIINKAITHIFLLPEERRPHFILMLAGNTVFLFDKDKWAKGSYLQFSLDDLFAQASIDAKHRTLYALFHMLVSKHTLAAEGEMVLMDTIIEESYKNAYEVTKDLKEGVILAVETLANEALYWWKQNNNIPVSDYTDDTFESEVKDDCLTIIYRLLFLFYAESRDELEILPVDDEVYKLGYSLESLRDLEMVRLNSDASRNGYFFDDSIRHLFSLLSDGHNFKENNINSKSFRVRPIDSPLFNDNNLKHLANVRIRNIKWQEIIKALSLSKKKNYCGRISYANLGVNQLGSVYESLLAFRGFYAEEDYIEVHKANTLQDGTFLVPYSRMGDFDISEVLCDPKTGNPVILPEGTFVYRLNGRDRQKSASYYTPEVLTRSTVKYTLKSILDEVRANKRQATELLELKILEPAMGAAAFQNEVINQLAEAYLAEQQRQQREKGLRNWRISPDHYRDELQKVKAYIATHNVYGVDLNPTAIELGKLSLWLNVIHKDMETPFFANRLTVGNAVIGAWLKVYNKQDVYGIMERHGAKPKVNKWWEKAPHKVKFFSNRVNRSVNEVYHFLLPDANMLGVRSIKEQKKAHTGEDKRMAAILKDWTAPIVDADFKTLQRISGKIDVLLKEYFTDQISIDKYTNNRKEIWDGIDHSASESLFKVEEQAESYANKQQLFDTRYRHDNAYRKLKLAMDYWCALWFWEYDDADDLPTRQEFWGDIEALLDVDNSQLDTKTRQALERGESSIAQENSVENNRMTEEESQIVAKTQEEILMGSHAQMSLFADEDPLRLKIADRLAKRYHFFHPMLEFIEVFWLRDGFDIICGNPPWIKLEFDEQGILSEKYPEVAIRKMSAPDVRKMRDQMFKQILATEALYHSEEIDTACSSKFMSAYCNYPLLVGQQTNLYKCVLENAMDMASESNGYIGLLTPESIYNDPKGQPLRRELYKRLRYHFQYVNTLKLFSEILHWVTFSTNVIGKRKENADFYSINNLYHPSTIDGCFVHDGHGLCEGLKTNEGSWNTAPHKERIVHYDTNQLQLLSNVFEDGTTNDCAKLVSIHSCEILNVLSKIETFQTHVRDFKHIITECFHETGAPKAGIIVRDTHFPDIENYDMIYNGPHIYVANAYSKTPRTQCIVANRDYDTIDLFKMKKDFVPRSNYRRNISVRDIRAYIHGFLKNENDKDSYENYLDYYKVGFRNMLSQSGERTLICAVLPCKTAHIHGVRSISFLNRTDTVDMAALCSSIVMDFYMKTIGSDNLMPSRMQSFPLGVAPKYQSATYSRTLLLNCLTVYYTDLWQEMWDEAYKQETWSLDDPRLKPFDQLHEDWSWDIPLRNYFERRQALVEIDVIAAMALGLTLEDLEMIYTIQFPVLQQNEADTWYDQKGNIVFTCSSGLKGVGLERKRNARTGMLGWEDIRGEQIDENTYAGTSPTHTNTIDPAKSELYGGQQVTYYAPYTKCDRIADYRRAWAHFEKIFNK
jgi:hypothetical protein